MAKIKASSLPDDLRKIIEKNEKRRNMSEDDIRKQDVLDYLNERKSAGTLLSGTLTEEEKEAYRKRDAERGLSQTAPDPVAVKPESEKQAAALEWQRKRAEDYSKKQAATADVIVLQNDTRNMSTASPAQSFISNRAREQEEEKLGTLAMAVRSGVNEVKGTGKTQYDLPTANVPKTAKELEIQRQAGQYGITTAPATDEEIRLAKKYNVSVDDIRAARKIIDEEQRSTQNSQTVLPGISRPFTSEEIAQMNTEKKTSGGIKEVSDTITYTGAALGLGAADTLKNTTSGIRTTAGDLATRGAYSDGYKKIENYLSGGGMSGFAKNIIYTTDENGKKMVAANWKDELSRALSERVGVSPKIAAAYIDTVETEGMLKLLGENVNDKYKETVGKGAYTIGQQIPGILLTMGYANIGDDAVGFVADKVSKNAAAALIGTSVYGSTVNQLARERGYDPANYLNAVLQGTVESALEKAFGFTDAASFKKFVTPTGSTGKTVLKSLINYIGTGAEEGLEEAINVPASEIIDRMTGVSENTNWIGDGGIFDFEEMLKNGLSGAAVGMFMGSAAAISGITSAVQESKDIKTALWNLEHSIMTELPDEYKPKNRITDASRMTLENFYAYEAEVARGYVRYMNDIANGKTDFHNAEGDAYTAKISALETAISSAESTNPETLAVLVREIAGNTEGDKDAINKTVDFVRGEIQNMNNIIATTTDAKVRQEATVNRQNYIDVDKTLRSHRAEIDEILAKTPTQTHTETSTEQPESAPSETVTETVTEDESTAEEAPVESESEAQEEEETSTERPTVSQEFRRSFEQQTGSLYGSSASSAARNLVSKLGTTQRAAGLLNYLDQVAAETDADETEHNEMQQYIADIRSSVLEMAAPNAEHLAATASAALKKYGVSVVVDTDESSIARYRDGSADGWYDGEAREIHVSPFVSDEKTFGMVVLHEFTHHAEVADNTLVNEITGAIGRLTDKKVIDPGRYDFKRYSTIYSGDAENYLSTKSGKADVAAYIKRGMNEAEARAEVQKNYINGEIAADFMGDLMENQSFMQAIKKDDRSFLQKIHDLLRGLAARLTGNTEVWRFEQAADKIRTVLQETTGESVKPRTKNASRKRVESSDTERASRRVFSDEERAKMREQERKAWLERQLVQLAADGSAARALSVSQKDKLVAELAAGMDGVSQAEVRDTIKDVFNVIEHPKATTKAAIAQEINDAAHKAAETLYNNFKVENINPLAEQYGDLYSKIRTTKLNIKDEIRTEIPEWPQYYKSIFGKIHLVKDGGMSVDSFYNEMSANYPEVFSREVTNEGEQLQRLVEVAEELRPVAGHPFYDASQAEESAYIDSIAGAIIAGYQRYSSETVAAQNRRLRDENKKLSQEAEKARVYATDARATVQWYQAEAESMNLDFVNTMNALQRKIDAAEAETERIRKRVVLDDQKAQFDSERRRAESVLGRINRRLQNPSKSNRIPAELRSAVVSFFDAAKGSGVDADVVSTGTTAVQEEKNLSKYANYASRVVNVMKNLSESPKGDSPDYLAVTKDTLDILTQKTSALWSSIDTDNAPDAEQSAEIMRQFADICEMVDYHLRNADKVFMGNKKINAEKFSMDWRKDLKSCKPVLLAKQEYESESSAQFLGTLGREGEQISTALNEAQDLQMQRQAEYVSEVIKLFDGEKYNTFDASIKGKQIKVTINGAELVTSRAQLMTIHALWRRPAGRRHLMYGGANFVNAKGETRSDRQFRIDKKTYEQLMTHLSARDKKIAEGLSRILSEVCGTWGNDASMKLYGIMLYNDPLYFPIVGVDDAFSASWDFMSKDSGTDMPGFSRKVDPNAVNPIKIMDIFDVADSHAMRMASWSAFAPVTDGIRRIMNVSGTKTALTDKFGKPAWDYIDNLLNNIKENKMMDEAESLSLLKKMESNYKRQAVSSSLSSTAKQFLSLPRVFGEIDAKYLVAANPVGAEYERAKSEMIKNSGLAKIKALGYSDLAIGRTIRSQYDPKYIPLALDFTKFPALNKVYRGAKWLETKESQLGSIPAETADLLTEVRIWKACELETDDKYKGLSPEERTRKITARFNDILGKTQVVDSVLSTSPLARNPFYKMVAPFTSETIKNNGWIYSAYRNWRNGRPGAKKHLAGVLVLSGITYGVLSPAVSAMFSALRDENDEETLEEALKRFLYYYLGRNPEADTEKGEKVWNIGESYVVQEFASSVPVPLLSILINIAGDALSGYETSRLDSEAFSNFMKKLSNYQKKAEQEPYKSTKTEFALGYEVITATSQLLGSSFNNLQRDLRAFARSIAAAIPTSEARQLRWEYNKWFYNLSNASARSQKNFYDLLVDAYNNGDMETYQAMLHDLQGLQTSQKQRGVSWSAMQKNIEEHGGKIEVGSPMWNVTVQSQFNLDTFVTNMKVESAIADVYRNALAAGADASQASKAIYKIPANESFTVYEGDEDDEDRKKIDVQMPYMDYERYTDDAGQYAYALVGRMVASGDWKELSWKQQLYALDKAYTYARAFYRHRYDSRYEINTKWMMEMLDGEERPNETASEILSHAADQDE